MSTASDELKKKIEKTLKNNIHGEAYVINTAFIVDDILNLIESERQQVVLEILESILKRGYGGGSWHRLIIDMIEQIRDREIEL